MSGEGQERRFSREFKLAALARMAAGENVSALCRELGIRRKLIYQWRDRFRRGGPLALRSRGRPTKAEVLAMQGGAAPAVAATGQAVGPPPPAPPDAPPDAPPAAAADELARARERIAALERTIGRQQVDLDFFKGALRRIEASRRPSDGPGGTGSSPRSRR